MKHLVTLLIGVAILGIAASHSHSASLGLRSSEAGEDSGEVSIPVYLDAAGDESVASLQCDLRFDGAALGFLNADVGEAAEGAEKLAHANLIRPDCVRIIVAGFNRTIIAPGPVAWIHFEAAGPLSETTIHLETAVLSDPHGNAVDVVLTPNTLDLGTADGIILTHNTSGSAIPKTRTRSSASYTGLIVAILGVGAAMLWARKRPRKGRRS